FVKLAGGAAPTARKIDGVDIWPVLSGQARASTREAQYYFNANRLEAVRSGHWKLAITPQYEGTPGSKPPSMRPGDSYPPRLYNLDEDIGERNDVAAANPEVVSRLMLLVAKMDADLGVTSLGPGVRPPGRVANPKPLLLAGVTSVVETPVVAPATAEQLAALRVGDRLGRNRAPQVANVPLRITVDVEPETRDGIILAHGGTGNGYSLHLRDGHVVFTVRIRSSAVAITCAAAPVGRLRIEARLGPGGAMTLLVNGEKAAEGQAGGLLPVQPQEAFCLGFDDAGQVGDYGPAGRFRGKIEGLRIATGN
ncbi:MAG TPA: hypothetical protein VKT77_14775, partial [Chthonomonadaceae bacterium]|nr:hypothetical protein [Chthonomonadaceae bacterium]